MTSVVQKAKQKIKVEVKSVIIFYSINVKSQLQGILIGK
jgi:hypothetical protein